MWRKIEIIEQLVPAIKEKRFLRYKYIDKDMWSNYDGCKTLEFFELEGIEISIETLRTATLWTTVFEKGTIEYSGDPIDKTVYDEI